MGTFADENKWYAYAARLGLRWPEQGVALALATYADSDGWAWPSRDTLLLGCGVSKRRLLKVLNNLVALGVIGRERGGGRGKTSRYRFTLAPPVATTDALKRLILQPFAAPETA